MLGDKYNMIKLFALFFAAYMAFFINLYNPVFFFSRIFNAASVVPFLLETELISFLIFFSFLANSKAPAIVSKTKFLEYHSDDIAKNTPNVAILTVGYLQLN